jgi:FkbM family methyltransferase
MVTRTEQAQTMMIRRARAFVSQAPWKIRLSRGVVQGSRRVHRISVHGKSLRIADGQFSYGALIVGRKLATDVYALDGPGDVVIDIGAHVGLISCYLAKCYPFLRIYAFEPCAENYENLMLNLKNNDIRNVVPFHQAVTGDGRVFQMLVNQVNTAASTGEGWASITSVRRVLESRPRHLIVSSRIVTLARCRLLKIDCEGSEHEILNTCSVLDRVDYLSAEFHINGRLRNKGYSTEQLLKHCEARIAPQNIRVQVVNMVD